MAKSNPQQLNLMMTGKDQFELFTFMDLMYWANSSQVGNYKTEVILLLVFLHNCFAKFGNGDTMCTISHESKRILRALHIKLTNPPRKEPQITSLSIKPKCKTPVWWLLTNCSKHWLRLHDPCRLPAPVQIWLENKKRSSDPPSLLTVQWLPINK